jgi:hypothetical protein
VTDTLERHDHALNLSAEPDRPVIVFTVGGRMPYLLETLTSWSLVRGISQATMIFLVEPGQDRGSMRAAKEAVDQCLDARLMARRALVMLNPEHRGVLANPWHAMEAGFAMSDFVILAEEDTPVSSDVLEYFDWASREYAGDVRTWAVCAHQIGAPLGDESTVIRSAHFSPVVWGTWGHAWRRWIRDSWTFDYSHNGWDWNLNRLMAQNDGQVIIPARSRSQHIGREGGAHCTADMFADTVSWSWSPSYTPQSYHQAPWYQHRESRHDGQHRTITAAGGLTLPPMRAHDA